MDMYVTWCMECQQNYIAKVVETVIDDLIANCLFTQLRRQATNYKYKSIRTFGAKAINL